MGSDMDGEGFYVGLEKYCCAACIVLQWLILLQGKKSTTEEKNKSDAQPKRKRPKKTLKPETSVKAENW